jgi:hypothetical protein
MSMDRQAMLQTTHKLLKHQYNLLQERDHDIMLLGAKLGSYMLGFILGNTINTFKVTLSVCDRWSIVSDFLYNQRIVILCKYKKSFLVFTLFIFLILHNLQSSKAYYVFAYF